MKKFFLSLAVMLSAATMNVNAMSDSWVYQFNSLKEFNAYIIYQTEDNFEEVYSEFNDEVLRLLQEFCDEHGGRFKSLMLLSQLSQYEQVEFSYTNIGANFRLMKLLREAKAIEDNGGTLSLPYENLLSNLEKYIDWK